MTNSSGESSPENEPGAGIWGAFYEQHGLNALGERDDSEDETEEEQAQERAAFSMPYIDSEHPLGKRLEVLHEDKISAYFAAVYGLLPMRAMVVWDQDFSLADDSHQSSIIFRTLAAGLSDSFLGSIQESWVEIAVSHWRRMDVGSLYAHDAAKFLMAIAEGKVTTEPFDPASYLLPGPVRKRLWLGEDMAWDSPAEVLLDRIDAELSPRDREEIFASLEALGAWDALEDGFQRREILTERLGELDDLEILGKSGPLWIFRRAMQGWEAMGLAELRTHDVAAHLEKTYTQARKNQRKR